MQGRAKSSCEQLTGRLAAGNLVCQLLAVQTAWQGPGLHGGLCSDPEHRLGRITLVEVAQ
jgi:hypothetical protein